VTSPCNREREREQEKQKKRKLSGIRRRGGGRNNKGVAGDAITSQRPPLIRRFCCALGGKRGEEKERGRGEKRERGEGGEGGEKGKKGFFCVHGEILWYVVLTFILSFSLLPFSFPWV